MSENLVVILDPENADATYGSIDAAVVQWVREDGDDAHPENRLGKPVSVEMVYNIALALADAIQQDCVYLGKYRGIAASAYDILYGDN